VVAGFSRGAEPRLKLHSSSGLTCSGPTAKHFSGYSCFPDSRRRLFREWAFR
jgi:hypothetical protein